ncbi:MAG: sigma-70 family RNA polymerase sigma factor [Kineosporiaceae bacterium]
MVNASRSRLRRRRTARAHQPPPPPATSVDDAVILAEDHAAVLAALAHLPARQREVLVLRYWSQLTEAGIASAMGVSPGTVKSTASRALARLAQLLEER